MYLQERREQERKEEEDDDDENQARFRTSILIDGRVKKKQLGQPERGSLRVQNRFEFFVGDFAVVVETIRFFDHFLNILLGNTSRLCPRGHAALDDRYLGDMFT